MATKRTNTNQETIELLRESTKKLWQNPEYAEKVLTGKRVVQSETNEKISKAMTGKKKSRSHRKALSEHNTIRYQKNEFIGLVDVLTTGSISSPSMTTGAGIALNALSVQVTNQLSNHFGVSSQTIQRKYETWVQNNTSVLDFFNKRETQ